MADYDEYDYPVDIPEIVEQAEAEPETDLRSAEQLEGIQRWLAGDVDLEESSMSGDAEARALILEVEALKADVTARDEAAAEARAAVDAQAEGTTEPPSYAQELREESMPEGALAEAQAEAAIREQREAEAAEQLQRAVEQAVSRSPHLETTEMPERPRPPERLEGGL